MTLQEITAKMKEGAAKKSSFGNTVKFSTDQGVVYIDGNANPPAVSNDDKAADCTLNMAFSDFDDMINGNAPNKAAVVAIRIGRNRSRHAWYIASRGRMFSARSASSAKSTIRIAFFFTIPMSRRRPIIAMTLNSVRNSISANRAPTLADGSVDKIVIG